MALETYYTFSADTLKVGMDLRAHAHASAPLCA